MTQAVPTMPVFSFQPVETLEPLALAARTSTQAIIQELPPRSFSRLNILGKLTRMPCSTFAGPAPRTRTHPA